MNGSFSTSELLLFVRHLPSAGLRPRRNNKGEHEAGLQPVRHLKWPYEAAAAVRSRAGNVNISFSSQVCRIDRTLLTIRNALASGFHLWASIRWTL